MPLLVLLTILLFSCLCFVSSLCLVVFLRALFPSSYPPSSLLSGWDEAGPDAIALPHDRRSFTG